MKYLPPWDHSFGLVIVISERLVGGTKWMFSRQTDKGNSAKNLLWFVFILGIVSSCQKKKKKANLSPSSHTQSVICNLALHVCEEE